MRGDRLFTFPSFKFQPVNLLMKVQSKVFQVQTLGGIRMDFPLSLVLSHILAIKIRYRSRLLLFPRCKRQNCRCCNVCLFDQLVPSPLSRLLLSQDARCRCFNDCLLVCLISLFACLTKMQETDFAIIVCLTSTLVYKLY